MTIKEADKKHTMNRIIDYALCYLNSNWDDNIEDDMGISNQTLNKLIKRFQEENISFDKTNNK